MGSLDSGKRWVCADRFGRRDAARGAFRYGGRGERAACHCGPGRAARLCAVAAAAGVAVGGSSHALRRGGAGKPAWTSATDWLGGGKHVGGQRRRWLGAL